MMQNSQHEPVIGMAPVVEDALPVVEETPPVVAVLIPVVPVVWLCAPVVADPVVSGGAPEVVAGSSGGGHCVPEMHVLFAKKLASKTPPLSPQFGTSVALHSASVTLSKHIVLATTSLIVHTPQHAPNIGGGVPVVPVVPPPVVATLVVGDGIGQLASSHVVLVT